MSGAGYLVQVVHSLQELTDSIAKEEAIKARMSFINFQVLCSEDSNPFEFITMQFKGIGSGFI